jgi:hypothetical protein
MIVNEAKNNEAELVSVHSNHMRKAYEKPVLTDLGAQDIGTGGTHVPENSSGLLQHS